MCSHPQHPRVLSQRLGGGVVAGCGDVQLRRLNRDARPFERLFDAVDAAFCAEVLRRSLAPDEPRALCVAEALPPVQKRVQACRQLTNLVARIEVQLRPHSQKLMDFEVLCTTKTIAAQADGRLKGFERNT